MFVPVPEAEMPDFLAALEERRCVTCYGEITAECGGEHVYYCHFCDDGCSGEVDRADD